MEIQEIQEIWPPAPFSHDRMTVPTFDHRQRLRQQQHNDTQDEDWQNLIAEIQRTNPDRVEMFGQQTLPLNGTSISNSSQFSPSRSLDATAGASAGIDPQQPMTMAAEALVSAGSAEQQSPMLMQQPHLQQYQPAYPTWSTTTAGLLPPQQQQAFMSTNPEQNDQQAIWNMQSTFGDFGPPPTYRTPHPMAPPGFSFVHAGPGFHPHPAFAAPVQYQHHSQNDASPRDENMEETWTQADATPNYSRDGSEAANDPQSDDPCYAKLLWQALYEAPDYMMTLKDLYDWVAKHTSKGKEGAGKGWQNSVRHNLSMNGAFERATVDRNHGSKKGGTSYWCLTPHALEHGIISTTRYRKDPKRRPERRGLPAPKRQQSGAKGGQATRNATRARQAREHQRLQQLQNQQQGMPYPMMTGHQHHRRQARPQYPGIFTSTPSQSTESSPQLSMMTSPAQQQASPYFVEDRHPQQAMPPLLLPSSNPHTPPDVHIQTPPDMPLLPFEHPAKSSLTSFEFGHINVDNGLFGSDDDYSSMATPEMQADDFNVGGMEGMHVHFSGGGGGYQQ